MSAENFTVKPWEDDIPYLICEYCGYEWSKYAFAWIGNRDLHFQIIDGVYVKALRCPRCRSENYINATDVAILIAWWKNYGKRALPLAFLPRPQKLRSVLDE